MKKKIFLIILIFTIIAVYKSSINQIIIPKTAIRLRVIPNSNSQNDLYIKEKVKKYLEDNIYELTKDVSDITEARSIIESSIPKIDEGINKMFIQNKYPQDYHIDYGSNYFPEKAYKGVKYEEGYYESLVISIGSANGDNWWCVLFPNFCLIDKDNLNNHKSIIKETINKYSKK